MTTQNKDKKESPAMLSTSEEIEKDTIDIIGKSEARKSLATPNPLVPTGLFPIP